MRLSASVLNLATFSSGFLLNVQPWASQKTLETKSRKRIELKAFFITSFLYVCGRLKTLEWAYSRSNAGTGAHYEVGRQPLGFRAFAQQELLHGLDRSGPQTQLGLIQGSQWNAKMLAEEDVAKADDRDVIGDFEALL